MNGTGDRCGHTIVNRSSCNSKTKACPFEWYCADPGAPNGGACGGSVVCGAETVTIDTQPNRAGYSGGTTGSEDLPELQGHPGPSRDAVWIEVDIAVGTDPGTVAVDLSKLNGSTPVAIRYAWSNNQPTCCVPSKDGGLFRDYPCLGGSCPLKTVNSGLPANPFMAKLTEGGSCKCIAPQQCDE
eukprot:COSAG02_NODE_2976_length_7633_cov_2.195248_4_plen_184_part_00